jgi:hypothetical protein
VAKRPDVLVIESGEILLPGDVSMKNIGLPKNVAYACLAETIVLALEGRFENFTVGRAIEWEKVRDIYKMGLKHGMRLAAISGVNGVYSDDDIEQVRQRALAARAALAPRAARRKAAAAEGDGPAPKRAKTSPSDVKAVRGVRPATPAKAARAGKAGATAPAARRRVTSGSGKAPTPT